MAKINRMKEQTLIYKALYRKLMVKQHESR